ncbi:unnamed protein product [Hydatigera taeniaeformis]|uniref:Uridylate-specific endoribonuclease n=1 Tax=Hydatigena taeniaeformis TaxID=6205 RepID=A0A158RE91_HYDTA|nr:unnamed protein product [Hydatigera taeniaeformis]
MGIPAFEKLVNKLWELDANRLEINKDIILNLQAFIDLMRFYDPNVLVVESSSPEKIQSQKAFLDAILATPLMAEVRRYLEEKKLASPIDEEFKDMLGHLWFSAFKRKKRLSSSAFEHVFLGEGRGTKVLGFHYWLPLYLHEQEGSLNYFGYYEKVSDLCIPLQQCSRDHFTSMTFTMHNPIALETAMHFAAPPHWQLHLFLTSCSSRVFSASSLLTECYFITGQGGLQNLLSVAFEWNSDWVKKHAKFLVGTSPEFEMGVYTAAFLTMNSIWPDGFRYALSLRLNRSRMAVQCYRNSKVILGSCYIV